MMCKLKGRMDKGGHYDVKWVVVKEGNMMCKLIGQMDKGGHYDVQIKRLDGIWGHYDVQIKREDG